MRFGNDLEAIVGEPTRSSEDLVGVDAVCGTDQVEDGSAQLVPISGEKSSIHTVVQVLNPVATLAYMNVSNIERGLEPAG